MSNQPVPDGLRNEDKPGILGFRLDDVRSFKGKHMVALARSWESRGLSPSTIQNNISIFRVFAGWIGKSGMALPSKEYVGPGKAARTSINRIDKSWTSHGIDPTSKIEEVRVVDPRVAIQLELQRVFKLRPKEAINLRPHLADQKNFLAVNWGAKGGRHRVVRLDTAEQRRILNVAKTFAAKETASMCDPKITLGQGQAHYYRVMAKCGITKKSTGITSYGLRHAKSNDDYCKLTGLDSPVRGGGPVPKELDDFARHVIAEELGHSRAAITTHYLGRNSRQ